MKYLLVLFLIAFVPNNTQTSDVIDLSFVEKSLNLETREIAEILLQNEFNARRKNYFEKPINGETHISVDVVEKYGQGKHATKYVDFTFHYKPYDTYEKIEQKVKEKYDKSSYFWSNYFETYVTEFKTDSGNYIYIWQNNGGFKTESGKIYQNYCVTISEKTLKPFEVGFFEAAEN